MLIVDCMILSLGMPTRWVAQLGAYLRMFAQFDVIIVVSVEECVVAHFEVIVAV